MSRTVCAAPTDASLWRQLVARAHPDSGGSEHLFVWANSVRELVCGDYATGRIADSRSYATGAERDYASSSYSSDMPERIPFEWFYTFEELTARALRLAKELDHPFRE